MDIGLAGVDVYDQLDAISSLQGKGSANKILRGEVNCAFTEKKGGDNGQLEKSDFDYMKLRTSDQGEETRDHQCGTNASDTRNSVQESSAESSITKESSGNSSESETSEDWDPENDTESNYSSTDESFDWNDSGSEGSSFVDDLWGGECPSEEDESKPADKPPQRLLFECALVASAMGPFEQDAVKRQMCVRGALDDSFPQKDLTEMEVAEIRKSTMEVLDKHTQARLSGCSAYSIVVQEMCDQFNDNKFSLFVQYFCNGEVKREFLAYLDRDLWPNKTDIVDRILNELKKYEIDLERVISVGSDGAPIMWNSEENVFSLLMKKMFCILPLHIDVEHITDICRHAVNKDMNMLTSYCRLLRIMFYRIALEMRDRRSRKVAPVIETYLEKFIDPRWVSWETSYDGLKALLVSYRAIVSLLWDHFFDTYEDDDMYFVHEHVYDPGSESEEDGDEIGKSVSEYCVPAFTAVFMDILTILNDMISGVEEALEQGYSDLCGCYKKAKESLDDLKRITGENYGAFLSNLKAEAGNFYYEKVKLRKITASGFVDEVRLKLISAVSDCLTDMFPDKTLEVFEALSIIEPSRIADLSENQRCRYAQCLSQQFRHLLDGSALENELQEVESLVKDMDKKECSLVEFATHLVQCNQERLPQCCRLAEIALCLPVKFPKGEAVYKARCESVEKVGRLSSEELTIALRVATSQDLYKNWKCFPIDEAYENWQSKKFANDKEIFQWLADDGDESDQIDTD